MDRQSHGLKVPGRCRRGAIASCDLLSNTFSVRVLTVLYMHLMLHDCGVFTIF